MDAADAILPLIRHEQTGIMESHLLFGNAVEIVEDDNLSFVEGVVKQVKISEGMVLVSPISEVAGSGILVERRRLRPPSYATSYSLSDLKDLKDRDLMFRMHDHVEVWIEGKWLVGVIVHTPSGTEDSYHVHIFREDCTVSVCTKMRVHLEWDNINGWTRGICKLERERLRTPNQSKVGLVGSYRAKILQHFDDEHILVEYIDLTHADGTHAKEIIKRRKWNQSVLGKMWEGLRAWIDANDPVQEFGCYMPAYICLGILGLVSPILFTDYAQSWPNEMVALFYSLGGCSFFLCLFIVIGLMCRQPKTRGQLNKWRVICLIAVAIGVVFMVLHAFYGRSSVVASRKPKRQGTDILLWHLV